jgi:hypothetical protein
VIAEQAIGDRDQSQLEEKQARLDRDVEQDVGAGDSRQRRR